VKRGFDVVLILVTAPVWVTVGIVVSLLTQLTIGSPTYFTQLRPGLRGKPFRIVKFRTMTNAFDSEGNPLPDAQRLTRFGRFLRSTSLDELPELWNVLRGDMSLVGPRPLLMEYLPLYTSQQLRRHDVRPGITGWAQVNGRNSISWEEKFTLDLWYVEHRSFALDSRILLLTLGRVLRRQGISARSEPTMPRFVGTASRERQ
jgi:lipopolysaccharide/colanic/teichoic acid biosynthesis glycosyltransferase